VIWSATVAGTANPFRAHITHTGSIIKCRRRRQRQRSSWYHSLGSAFQGMLLGLDIGSPVQNIDSK
jgi:hypothetical protein